MAVEHGYVLTDSDYPTVPAKTGYSGAWEKYTEPVTRDVTVEAVYTINKYTVKFVANGVTVKNMTVNYGYTLKTSDYPAVPVVGGKTGEWIRYTRPITRNITITARYSDAGINPPVKPPIETSSIDGAASNNGTVKETVTARHSYIYTSGQLAQETITTTVTPADGTVASATDTISATTNDTMSAAASDSVVTTAENSTTTTETLYYAYDASGIPMSLTYTDAEGVTETYYYTTNIQGDVTAILDTTGTAVVEYTYDAWGNSLTVTGTMAGTLGKLNSLRYRGYVYDTETELYYVSSRYYDPEIARWINADIPETLTADFENFAQYNLFAYCFNNPVNMSDKTGTWPSWVTKAVAVVAVAAVAVAATAITVATCGAGSVAGVAMITATATLAAKTTEVAVLQVKKGKAEGKSGGQIAKDTVESIYDNGSKIVGLTPVTKSAGIAFNHALNVIVEKAFGGTQTLSATLKSTGGKVVPYAFVAIAWMHTIISAFSNDPVTRANARGYVLK